MGSGGERENDQGIQFRKAWVCQAELRTTYQSGDKWPQAILEDKGAFEMGSGMFSQVCNALGERMQREIWVKEGHSKSERGSEGIKRTKLSGGRMV